MCAHGMGGARAIPFSFYYKSPVSPAEWASKQAGKKKEVWGKATAPKQSLVLGKNFCSSALSAEGGLGVGSGGAFCFVRRQADAAAGWDCRPAGGNQKVNIRIFFEKGLNFIQ